MTPGEEHQLYERDPAAWIDMQAPSMANGFALMDDEGCANSLSRMSAAYTQAVLRLVDDVLAARMWRLMSRTKQESTWAQMSESERERIKKLRAPQTRKDRA